MTRLLSLLTACLFALILASGCGDNGEDGGMTIEEYLQAIEAELREAEADSEAVFDNPEFVDVATSTGELSEEDRAIVRDTLDEIAEAFDGFIDDVESLTPPADLEDEHEEFVGAYSALQVQYEDEIIGRVDEAATIEDLDELFTALETVGERTSAACEALQQVATDENVAVSLEC
jgi:hypothetical protein